MLVRLTESGLSRVDAAFSDLLAVEHTVLEALDPADEHAMADLLRRLVAQFDTLT